MTNPLRTLALACTLACAVTSTAAAQLDETAPRSRTTGLNVALFANGSALSVEESAAERGGGGGLLLGYGVSPSVSLFVRGNAAMIGTDDPAVVGGSYTLANFDVGARYSFGSSEAATRPYMHAAVSGQAFSMDLRGLGTMEGRGAGFAYGFGMEHFFTPSLALDVGLTVSNGGFTDVRMNEGEWVDMEESLSSRTARLDLGLSFHP